MRNYTSLFFITCSIVVTSLFAVETAFAATDGPLDPATVTAGIFVAPGEIWVSPASAQSIDGSFADIPLGPGIGAGNLSNSLDGTLYPFSIPAGATIDGIEVNVLALKFLNEARLRVQLVQGGLLTGDVKLSGTLSSGAVPIIFGGSSDLWGAAWADTDFDSTFAVVVVAELTAGTLTGVQVDGIQVTVHYTAAAAVPTASRWTLVGLALCLSVLGFVVVYRMRRRIG